MGIRRSYDRLISTVGFISTVGWYLHSGISQYRKSHCGDKTILRSSYLHSGISYTGKKASLYWISPQDIYKQNNDQVQIPYTYRGHIYYNGLTLIPAWVSNFIRYKVWGEITYALPNFKSAAVEVWEWIFLSTLYWACDYLSMLGLKLTLWPTSDAYMHQ